ncbi:hypothetical protein, partial [Pantoea sp. BAV 3049]|uniref:hypothetical protein n=1 Tax=Pantoea sp. BAV 3049 TaxID=2654188 RepID=UPI001E2F88EE
IVVATVSLTGANVGKSPAAVNTLSLLFRPFSQFYSRLLFKSAKASFSGTKSICRGRILSLSMHNNALQMAGKS